MIRSKREITIKVIENKKININKLAEFFARKYNNRNIENRKKKVV